MEKIDITKFNNKEYLKYIKKIYPTAEKNEITKLDNFITFLASKHKSIPNFPTHSKELFGKLQENCWLQSAEEYFTYLLQLIKNGILSIEDIIYLINTSYLNIGFKAYLTNYIAHKEPSRFQHNMRKFSELDPIVEKLIKEYNLNKEKAI